MFPEGGVAAGEGTQVLQHALQIVADWMEVWNLRNDIHNLPDENKYLPFSVYKYIVL